MFHVNITLFCKIVVYNIISTYDIAGRQVDETKARNLRRADERVLLLRRRGRPLVLAAAEEDAAAPPAPPVE